MKFFERMSEKDTRAVKTMISAFEKFGKIKTMADGSGKFPSTGYAKKLFDEMKERSALSWTSLIAGFREIGSIEDLIPIDEAMEVVSTEPLCG